MIQRRAGKMAPWVRCLIWNNEDPGSISRSHAHVKQRQARTVSYAQNPRTEEAETAHAGASTASQPHKLGNFQANEKRVSRANVDDTWGMPVKTNLRIPHRCSHVCTRMCIRVHTHLKPVQWFSMLLSSSGVPPSSTIRFRKTQQ